MGRGGGIAFGGDYRLPLLSPQFVQKFLGVGMLQCQQQQQPFFEHIHHVRGLEEHVVDVLRAVQSLFGERDGAVAIVFDEFVSYELVQSICVQ